MRCCGGRLAARQLGQSDAEPSSLNSSGSKQRFRSSITGYPPIRSLDRVGLATRGLELSKRFDMPPAMGREAPPAVTAKKIGLSAEANPAAAPADPAPSQWSAFGH